MKKKYDAPDVQVDVVYLESGCAASSQQKDSSFKRKASNVTKDQDENKSQKDPYDKNN